MSADSGDGSTRQKHVDGCAEQNDRMETVVERQDAAPRVAEVPTREQAVAPYARRGVHSDSKDAPGLQLRGGCQPTVGGGGWPTPWRAAISRIAAARSSGCSLVVRCPPGKVRTSARGTRS